jgi:hypothetical protein
MSYTDVENLKRRIIDKNEPLSNTDMNIYFRWACMKSKIDIAKILLNLNFEIEKENYHYISAIIDNNDIDMMKFLINNNKIDLTPYKREISNMFIKNGRVDLLTLFQEKYQYTFDKNTDEDIIISIKKALYLKYYDMLDLIMNYELLRDYIFHYDSRLYNEINITRRFVKIKKLQSNYIKNDELK